MVLQQYQGNWRVTKKKLNKNVLEVFKVKFKDETYETSDSDLVCIQCQCCRRF